MIRALWRSSLITWIIILSFAIPGCCQDSRSAVDIYKTAKNDYLMLAPKVFRPGAHLHIGILVLNPAWAASPDTEIKFEIVDATGTAISRVHVNKFEPGVLSKSVMEIPSNVDPTIYYDLKFTANNVPSLTSGKVITEKRRILLSRNTASLFIQLDKSLYRGGDILLLRVIALQPDLTPYESPVNLYIKDSMGHRIAQWIDVHPKQGVITSEFQLGFTPLIGKWSIHAYIEGEHEIVKSFEISGKVLPIYEVLIDVEHPYQIVDQNVTGRVRALYKFGEPVHATATLKIHFGEDSGCERVYQQSIGLPEGVYDYSIPYDRIKELCSTGNDSNPSITSGDQPSFLTVEVTVTDDASKIEANAMIHMPLHRDRLKLLFLPNNPTAFKPGLSYIGYLKVTGPDGVTASKTDILNKELMLKASGNSDGKPVFFEKTYPLHGESILRFEIPIPNDIITLNIFVHLKNVDNTEAQLNIVDVQESITNSYLALTLLATENVVAGEVAEFEVRSSKAIQDLFYLIISKGNIIEANSMSMSGSQLSTFYVPITPEMGPAARILAFYVEDGQLIIDALNFRIQGGFRNNLQANFKTPEVLPHVESELRVETNPGSLVCVLALDKRVVIYNQDYDVTPIQVELSQMQYDTTEGGFAFLDQGVGGSIIQGSIGGRDAAHIIDQSGLQSFTDAVLSFGRSSYFEPEGKCTADGDCSLGPYTSFGRLLDYKDPQASYVRQNFPDTWIWECKTAENGTLSVTKTSPDYLTNWITSVFSIHPQLGFAILPAPIKLRVFAPFFTFVKTPRYVTLGEVVIVRIVVFYYDSQKDVDDLKDVSVEIRDSPQFLHIMDNEGNTKNGSRKGIIPKLKNHGSGVIKFPIKPTKLGVMEIIVDSKASSYSDSVQQLMEIRAPGIAAYATKTLFLDLKKGSSCSKGRRETQTQSDVLNIQTPDGFLPGTLNLAVAVTGDLLGPVLHGFMNDQFLQFMPIGCAEQNLIFFGPLIYTLRYLNATNQLEDAFNIKAKISLRKGYMVELSFQREDGSFATFPPLTGVIPTDPPVPVLPQTDHNKPSTWLTAFVVKLLTQGRSHVYIEDKVILNAITWLGSKQLSTGQFTEDGALLLDSIQGADSKNVISLTAFVIIALLEAQKSGIAANISEAVFDRAVTYLEGNIDSTGLSLNDSYKLAVTCYALRLADRPSSVHCLKVLLKAATHTNEHMYWSYYVNERLSVETAGYALLALLPSNSSPAWRKGHSQQNMNLAVKVANWLLLQQSQYGGFHSTQDTIIALQALALYAELTYCPNPRFRVHIVIQGPPEKDLKIHNINNNVSTVDGFKYEFNVNGRNRKLYQTLTIDLPQKSPSSAVSINGPAEGDGYRIVIKSTGQGVGLAQITMKFSLDEKVVSKNKGKIPDTSNLIQIIEPGSFANELKPGAPKRPDDVNNLVGTSTLIPVDPTEPLTIASITDQETTIKAITSSSSITNPPELSTNIQTADNVGTILANFTEITVTSPTVVGPIIQIYNETSATTADSAIYTSQQPFTLPPALDSSTTSLTESILETSSPSTLTNPIFGINQETTTNGPKLAVIPRKEISTKKPPFALFVATLVQNNGGLHVKACVRWTANTPEDSGFTTLEMGTPSGYRADLGSVSLIDQLASVKEDTNKLVFYLNGVENSNLTCLEYKLAKVDIVGKQNPVPCKIYQYYNPALAVIKFLDAVTERIKSICELCAEGCLDTCSKTNGPSNTVSNDTKTNSTFSYIYL